MEIAFLAEHRASFYPENCIKIHFLSMFWGITTLSEVFCIFPYNPLDGDKKIRFERSLAVSLQVQQPSPVSMTGIMQAFNHFKKKILAQIKARRPVRTIN